MEISEFQENSLLYLYSTAPQVLGAILALLGVFHVLRMEYFKDRILRLGERIVEELNIVFDHDKIISEGTEVEPGGYLTDLANSLQGILNESNISLLEAWVKANMSEINSMTFNFKPDETVETANLQVSVKRESFFIEQLNTRKKATASLFIFNGIILLLLIASFLVLPLYAETVQWYRLGMLIAVVLTTISLYSMIGYIYGSVHDEYQRGIFFNLFKRRIHSPISEYPTETNEPGKNEY